MTDQELITPLQEAGQTRPGDRRAAYALGLMHLERQDGESAIKALKEAGSEVREAASAHDTPDRARKHHAAAPC
jgi:hypothetical protein